MLIVSEGRPKTSELTGGTGESIVSLEVSFTKFSRSQ